MARTTKVNLVILRSTGHFTVISPRWRVPGSIWRILNSGHGQQEFARIIGRRFGNKLTERFGANYYSPCVHVRATFEFTRNTTELLDLEFLN